MAQAALGCLRHLQPSWLGLGRGRRSENAGIHAGSFTICSVSGMSGLVEMQRTERLFALAEYLRGRRTGVTAETLAERFSVTVRTIYRDLDTLRAASMPVAAERGRGGGY